MTDLPTIGFGLGERAAFAVQPGQSRGRLYPEPSSPTRTPFQRDRDRIVHSTAFRRLKHKTQVFLAYEGDHYRTRLTHTIEVSQIARAFARAFRLDEDLTEAVALVHDFGHTPFGHAGERALHACMAAYGGFDHNAQALRIVTALERRYAEFDGLNLAYETLEGLVKHNGPLLGPQAAADAPVPRPILDFDAVFPLHLETHASLEAQSAAISDDIAYDTHDLDDGMRAGLIDVEDLAELPLAGDILREVRRAYPTLDRSRLVHEIMRRHITRMVEDVIVSTTEALGQVAPASVDDVRGAGRALVGFSPAMRAAEAETKRFLFKRVYRDPSVSRVMDRAETIVRDLFARLFENPAEMPEEWRDTSASGDEARRARRVADYLSGMTDSYALAEHRRLFDVTPELR
ncbi:MULTISPECIES: deoxyguanosinetriphosphate triphosphohydrolase [unclassified Aureimonas]|uniref:deoxyguanosinetriphosphate triphosphohydrolase n=1 Tax=unclassified Aureimonas TaxID=2615206 RepID=UPI0006FE39B9|nr:MULTISPECIES: deoxyguanosinetriphosphate triphosphohydrolase [unclassified Aureimonas]KQT60531.1 deoxyguanosinetriphosphate triphosphohydrolase [Aureimonas sp. Leaf427]KQT79408.1 deoxyguanosinetriphosphate triphosphohydrolase [Aureimonas sp. Leaf460]